MSHGGEGAFLVHLPGELGRKQHDAHRGALPSLFLGFVFIAKDMLRSENKVQIFGDKYKRTLWVDPRMRTAEMVLLVPQLLFFPVVPWFLRS